MNVGIVICTRYQSSRQQGKCLYNLNGITLLEHLVERISHTGLKIVIAYPSGEELFFQETVKKLIKYNNVHLYQTATYIEEQDPLRRMYNVAEKHRFEAVVRICTDKIFVDPMDIEYAVNQFKRRGLDYLYSSSVTPGCGFEIISYPTIKEAANKFDNVEHISYAVKAVTQNYLDLDLSRRHNKNLRMLLDFPEDKTVLNIILATLGNDCSVQDAIKFLEENAWLGRINKLPEVTIYTCAHNAEKHISECIDSVIKQHGFKDSEYIIVDDFSSDKTAYMAGRYASLYRNIKYIRNGSNLGLSSSSNVALANARGRYIVRLDADDYFSSDTSIIEMLEDVKERDLDAIYPNNYFGALTDIQKGNEKHHVGGALFRTSSLNHIKFTDGLRGHEGFDLYLRAKEQLKIGYINKPLFFYRQSPASMSGKKSFERDMTKKEIEIKHGPNP
jgi:spore coat polysaccharide biosynthesis protein SpsF (cytidylyltransferase family)